MCPPYCQDMALVQGKQSKEEFRLYTQVYTFKLLHFCYLHCVCMVPDEECFCLYTMDSVWKSAYLLVQDFYVSSSIAMLYGFGATVFLILGPLPEVARSVTSGVRWSKFCVSSRCTSYLSTIESLWSAVLQKFTVTYSYPQCCYWKEKPWIHTVKWQCCALVPKKMLFICLPNYCTCSHSQT